MGKARRLFVFLFLLSCALAFCRGGQETPAARPAVTYLEGNATIDGVGASIGAEVPLGSTVKTAADSLCEIVFNVRNLIRIKENTTLVFNPRNLQRGSELRDGEAILILKKLLDTDSGGGARFMLRTQNAVAGVRGTSFFIKAESDGSTYVCCCNGTLHVEGEGGQGAKDIVANHHSAVRISRDNGGLRMAAAGLEFHADGDMEEAAAKIGVTIDWSKPER
jgi:ferric-dicitrate binding protein FerR (iron transport regulator)